MIYRRSSVRRWARRFARRAMALAAVAGTLTVGGIVASVAPAPAGATTALAVITQDVSGTIPAAGAPQPHSTAKIPVVASAVDPMNGDVAELSNTNQVFLVVNATHEPATDFGIGSSGTLVKGDVYLVAGNGTAHWPTPVRDGTTKAVNASIGRPAAVTFDANGNLIFAGRMTSRSYLVVVPVATGSFYGFSSMTAGYLYYLAGFSSNSAQDPPAPGITLPSAITIGTVAAGAGLVSAGVQNLVVGTLSALYFLNYSGSTQHLYGASESVGKATQFAGGGSGNCTSGAQNVTVPNLRIATPHLYADGTGNLYVANHTGPCTWVLPAATGKLIVDGASTTVVGGSAYKVAGDGIFPYTTVYHDGTPATATSVGCVIWTAEDLVGNLLLALNCNPTAKTKINAIDVVANSTGVYYGQHMTAGDVYTVAGAIPGTTPPSQRLGAFTGPMSVGADGFGDLYMSDRRAHVLYELTGAPKRATSVTLAVTPPNHATAGTTETLTATVTPSNIAGYVAFIDNGTVAHPLGTAAESAGVATIMLKLASGSHSLSAVFTSTTPGYGGSTSAAVSYTVSTTPYTLPAKSTTSQTGTITVTVPQEGIFELTIPATAHEVRLSTPTLTHTTHSVLTSTGSLSGVVLTTTVNSEPGWSVTAIVSTFAGGTSAHRTIPGYDLGWTPRASSNPTNGVTAGPSISSGTNPGLHAASLWAEAAVTKGRGTTNLSASFTLTFPETTHPATYKATFTVTAMR